MKTSFDKAAKDYDSDFTHSRIGLSQRARVWEYLESAIKTESISNVLELNCGTGEDAVFLSQLDCEVTATDVSKSMLAVARQKASDHKQAITFAQLDLCEPKLESSDKYDLIFSNFGGLNCLDRSQLTSLAHWSMNRLKKDGSLILVIMPRDTLLEKWYRIYKRDKLALRLRQSEQPIQVNVDGESVKTYFYNPKEIMELFPNAIMKKVTPTGFVPSYWTGHKLEPLLSLMSLSLNFIKIGGKYGDHYLMHLKK